MNFLKRLTNIDALIAFLILECLSITSFALGGLNVVFYVIGILVAILAIFLTFNRFSKNEATSLLLFMGLMLILSIFISFGNLMRDAYGAINVLVLLAINAFLFSGIALRRFKSFKPESILLTIGLSLALLTLISMIYSWTQYGFFYAVKFKDTPIYYYNAELFDVTKESFWLNGFAFKETSIATTGLFGVIESSFLLGLIFINPKKDKINFLLFLVVGLVGLIYLITIPNLVALLFLIPIAFVGIIYRFFRNKKHTGKIIVYGVLTIAALAFIFLVFALINASGNNGLSNFIVNNRILNRLFNNNGWMEDINVVLNALAKSASQLFFGLNNTYSNEEAIKLNTKMFEIELLKEGGLFALLFLLAFIVVTIFVISKYLKRSNDSDAFKITAIAVLVSFFIYSSFNYDCLSIIHEQNNYIAFFRSPITLVMLTLLGYIYTPLFLKDNEEYGKDTVVIAKEKPVKEYKSDYDFGEDDL